MTAELIEGARVVLDDRVETTSVRIEAGRITGIDVARDGATVVPGKGRLLAPAFVDVHGDAFERQIMPRPGVTIPVETALLETDRQLAANGIATAYHALTLSWEPGLRSVDTGWQVVRALQALQPRLTAENRLQLRWETFCRTAQPLIAHVIAELDPPALAFNDHTSTMLLHPDVAVQDRPFDQVKPYPVTPLDTPRFLKKMQDQARRAQLTVDAYIARLTEVWADRPMVPAQIARIAALARQHGVPMLSHDDSQPETRAYYRGLGARGTEFPMHERVFIAARGRGSHRPWCPECDAGRQSPGQSRGGRDDRARAVRHPGVGLFLPGHAGGRGPAFGGWRGPAAGPVGPGRGQPGDCHGPDRPGPHRAGPAGRPGPAGLARGPCARAGADLGGRTRRIFGTGRLSAGLTRPQAVMQASPCVTGTVTQAR